MTFSCLRGLSDEKSRLRKKLDPDYEASKNVSTSDLFSNTTAIYGEVKKQLNLFAKLWITMTIYDASLAVENAQNKDYKYSLLLATLSITCNLLITYSSIINLKYMMGHYKAHDSRFRMWIDYLMLTCFGILTTVVPMQLIDIVRMASVTLATFISCCDKRIVNQVSRIFNGINKMLTSLTGY